MKQLGISRNCLIFHVHFVMGMGGNSLVFFSPLVNMLKDHVYVFNEVTDNGECWRQQLLGTDLPSGYLISWPLTSVIAGGR